MTEEIIRTLTVDGLSYRYRVLPQPAPRTEPVVVLGGALQGMYGWPQMDEHLGPHADVVTADLPGMGGADPLPPGTRDDLLHAAVTGIIDDLGAERVNLFGFSYGASIAFGCARRAPGRIARLVLGGVPSHISEAQRDGWARAVGRLEAGDAEGLAALTAEALMCLDPERPVHRRDLALRYVRRSFVHALTHSPHAERSLRRALDHHPDFSGGLSGVPALVFAGEHDTVTSPERQRAFAATIEGSRFLTIGESDHWVVLERPDDVADLVARFVTDLPLESAPALLPLAALPRPRTGAAGHALPRAGG
ncbi:pimeloyl-ACP methyl ester carboxylesterase [Streptomyces sp. KhCrAH-43]|uniref:alpha/beta fold hydrolase n=1 Tax=Streptomyces TaxID=1883 RepID=UPI000372E19D|nr:MULTISPECIES: alpha/beta fold hydrolase [unclassified Streptomyces]MYS39303.1 alpha/beta fold hydrolase [Streptomyces sp. SID4920]MYX69618.1 alpha/beta fold hydrolase [Streptomyces sp. SID8373]RAJ59553.1 pimeloyl-ACP methyl ester carboxylesterase [Streptomyces sp. KhCrAH-43]